MAAETYDIKRQKAAARSAEQSAGGRDIGGGLPVCQNPDRREKGRNSLEFFLRTYFPRTFHLAWSVDHLKAIECLEACIRFGGLMAYAMPRGQGKSSLCEGAAVWAALHGYRRFIVIVGPDKDLAEAALDSIKLELENNELLYEDFPEVCYPIRRLQGIANRAGAQNANGVRTQIQWKGDTIVLPTITGSIASGTILRVAGLTGQIRGMKFKRADGKSARPDLAILDDPQTDESARSPSQVVVREKLITGAVLGLSGPGQKIAAIMPCTVIQPDDLSDRFLNHKKHPEWQGQRTKMVYQFPTNKTLWDQYYTIRASSLEIGNKGREATEFYKANRVAMDLGSVVSWEARFDAEEISAIQNAMNLRQDLGVASFDAEYQNDPKVEIGSGNELASAEILLQKFNGTPRGFVPALCDRLTSFIDVQGKALYWIVVGWSRGFGGAVVDFGTYPKQPQGYYTLANLKHTLANVFPKAGAEGRIHAGLDACTKDLFSRTWRRTDGVQINIERMLIDGQWGDMADVVAEFCRQSPHAANIFPSHGWGVGAKHAPFEQYRRKPGEILGDHWIIKPNRGMRAITIDTNFWKTFVHARLCVSLADKGCLSFNLSDRDSHQMMVDHLVSEYGVTTTGRGRTVTEFTHKPGKPDNHFLDGVVGCAVAASVLGVKLEIDGRKNFVPVARASRSKSYVME